MVGATGGLGREIARLLAGAGATLVLSARDSDQLAALGLPGTVVAADLTYPAAIRGLVDAAVAVTGHLDGVVVAAGVVAFGPAETLSSDVVDELVQVNSRRPSCCSRRPTRRSWNRRPPAGRRSCSPSAES